MLSPAERALLIELLLKVASGRLGAALRRRVDRETRRLRSPRRESTILASPQLG